MWKRGVYLTESVIMEKGWRLQRSLNLSLPQSEHTDIKFTIGWLHAFKKRHDFRCRRLHGEEGDADRAGAMVELPCLRLLVS